MATAQSRIAASTLILFLCYLAFISIGFPDAVLGVAWPSIRTTFSLPKTGLSFILVSSAIGYIASGLVAGKIIERLGVGRLLVTSTGLVATGLMGYAIVPFFPIFLLLAVLIGLGSGAIDSALNFFAAERFSEAVMNRLHAFFGVGALVGPLLMGGVLELEASWRWGYVIVGAILFLMMFAFVTTRNLWDQGSNPHTSGNETIVATPVRDVLRHHLVWIHIGLFFLCTGVEFTAGQWAFTVLRERYGQSEGVASLWAGLYWGALALGRLTLGVISARIGTGRMVQLGMSCNVIGGILYATGSFEIAVAGLMLMGFGMAPIFPLLMSLTP
ncbi:MAG: MFS transporter, partial [Thermomicrobiales bacterium]